MKSYLTLFVAIALGIGGMTKAAQEGHGDGKAKRTIVSQRDIEEKLDGKAARATVIELTIEPGGSTPPHRHPGPVFAYVVEGEYELGLNDQPVKTLKAGETFYEPTGTLHRVSRNPSAAARTRVLATMLHPRDAKDLVIPEPAKKE
jgi:quercetin dioxygenase-like cupin family protein